MRSYDLHMHIMGFVIGFVVGVVVVVGGGVDGVWCLGRGHL